MLRFVSWPSRGRAALAGTASAALATCAETENLWLAESNTYPREAARWTFTVSLAGEGGICQTSEGSLGGAVLAGVRRPG